MTAEGADVASHPESVSWITGALNDNVSPLANSQGNHVCLVWLNWDKVVRNDRHGVVVDGELLKTFGAAVDESQPMRFPRLELKF